MRINNNVMAYNAYRNLAATSDSLGKALEKLSSGFRINRAGDDAAGLVISQGLRAQIGGLRQATRNGQDGISVAQTAEGAMNETHAMLNRMRDLAVQAANSGSNDTTARQAAQTEINQLVSEVNRIASTAKFGAQNLLDGSFGTAKAESSLAIDPSLNGAGVTFGTGAGNNSFRITLTSSGANKYTFDVLVATATYATASSYQVALNAALATGAATQGLATDAVTATVTSESNGSWTVKITNNTTTAGNLSASMVVANVGTDFVNQGVTAATYTTGTGSGGVFQVGANINANEQITVAITDMRVTGGSQTAFTNLGLIDVVSNASQAQTYIDSAIASVSTARANLGAYQNRFESSISNLRVMTENLSASESRIRDTDMALEMTTFTRHQILNQAGTAMLAQANQVPQGVLSLLRG